MARDWAETLCRMKAKADRTDNLAEREIIMGQMLELADRHGVDIALLEQGSKDNPVTNKRIMFRNPFGIEKSRLYTIIARHFNCQVILPGGKARVHHLFGFPNDLALADVLYDLLWEFGAKELEAVIARETFYRAGDKKSFSTSFWYAYQVKIAQRLRMSREAHLQETTGAELVLVKRGEEVNEAVVEEYPHLRTIKSHRSVRSVAGLNAGAAAGEKANLGHPLG